MFLSTSTVSRCIVFTLCSLNVWMSQCYPGSTCLLFVICFLECITVYTLDFLALGNISNTICNKKKTSPLLNLCYSFNRFG